MTGVQDDGPIGGYLDSDLTAEDLATCGPLVKLPERQIVIQFNKLSGAGNEKVDKFALATVVSLYIDYNLPDATREREWLCDFAQTDSREAYHHTFIEAAKLSMKYKAPIANFDWK